MITQIVLGGKGQATNIVNVLQLLGSDTGGSKLLPIKGRTTSAVDGLAQPFELQLLQARRRQLLDLRFPVHAYHILLSKIIGPESTRLWNFGRQTLSNRNQK